MEAWTYSLTFIVIFFNQQAGGVSDTGITMRGCREGWIDVTEETHTVITCYAVTSTQTMEWTVENAVRNQTFFEGSCVPRSAARCNSSASSDMFLQVYNYSQTSLVVYRNHRLYDGSTVTCSQDSSHVNCRMKVIYGPKSVRIYPSVPRPIVTNGTAHITLTCKADDVYPAVTYSWSGVTCVNKNDSDGTCMFTPRVPEDEGHEVWCTARNTVTGIQKKENFSIQLNYPPTSPPEITTRDVLTVGENVTLTCTVKGGKPKVTSVTFYCGGEDDRTDVVDGVSVSSSVVIRVQPRHNNTRCECSAIWDTQLDLYRDKTFTSLYVQDEEQLTNCTTEINKGSRKVTAKCNFNQHFSSNTLSKCEGFRRLEAKSPNDQNFTSLPVLQNYIDPTDNKTYQRGHCTFISDLPSSAGNYSYVIKLLPGSATQTAGQVIIDQSNKVCATFKQNNANSSLKCFMRDSETISAPTTQEQLVIATTQEARQPIAHAQSTKDVQPSISSLTLNRLFHGTLKGKEPSNEGVMRASSAIVKPVPTIRLTKIDISVNILKTLKNTMACYVGYNVTSFGWCEEVAIFRCDVTSVKGHDKKDDTSRVACHTPSQEKQSVQSIVAGVTAAFVVITILTISLAIVIKRRQNRPPAHGQNSNDDNRRIDEFEEQMNMIYISADVIDSNQSTARDSVSSPYTYSFFASQELTQPKASNPISSSTAQSTTQPSKDRKGESEELNKEHDYSVVNDFSFDGQ